MEQSKETSNFLHQAPETDDVFARKNGEQTLTGAVYSMDNYANYCNDPATAQHVSLLLSACDTTLAANLNSVEITDGQLQEIADFVNESILTDESSQKEKVMSILKWIRANIKYEYGDQQPYNVFKNRYGVCQGYANLMLVMLHTQGIKATIANGFLVNAGGHAWNYVLADGTWYVADPTNRSNIYAMVDELDKYKGSLQPWSIDMPLLDDGDFVYDFRNKHFNVRTIKTSSEQVSVPFGAMGYRLTGFDPVGGINEKVKELYLSLNILSIGDYVAGLLEHGQQLENVFVWNSKNHSINDYDGCVYTVLYNTTSKENEYLQLLYIPGTKKEVNFAPVATIESKSIDNWSGVEILRFDENTLNFEDYAITGCDNLKEVYINKNATVSDKAFEDLPTDCQVIRFDPMDTGIKPIHL